MDLREPKQQMGNETETLADLHQRGADFLAQVYDRERGQNVQDALQTLSPRLGRYAVQLVYGGVYEDTSALSIEAVRHLAIRTGAQADSRHVSACSHTT